MKKAAMITLYCDRVQYGSPLDEDMFFAWLDKIPSLLKYEGRSYRLVLSFEHVSIPDDALRELLALFYRYQIDMKQLQQFLTDDNRAWFHGNKRAFWWHRVFGGVPSHRRGRLG